MTDLIFVPELGLLGPKETGRRGKSVPVRRQRPVVASTIPPTPEPMYFQPMLVPHPPTISLQQTPKFPTPKMHYMKEYFKRYEGLLHPASRPRQPPSTMRAASSGLRHRKKAPFRRLPDDHFKFPNDEVFSSFRPKTAPMDLSETIRLYTSRHFEL